MSETYQIFIRPGFTGDSEGREFVQRVIKRIKDKPVVADDKDGWLDYAMYPCASKVEVKKVIEDIIKSSKKFWGDKSDLFITIDDDTKKFYPSGEYNTKVNPSDKDWEGFVLVEIISGSKKHHSHSSAPAWTQVMYAHALNPITNSNKPVLAHKKKVEDVTAIDFMKLSSGQFKWGK